MKKLLALFGIVSIASAAFSAPTANEDFVVAEDARTYTNAVAAAKAYTDAVVADIDVDMSAVTNIAQEAAQTAQERAVASANASAAAATNAINASLSSRLSLVSRDATNYTDEVAGELATSIAGKYPASSGNQLAQQVAAIGAHINGEDAKVMVTNYNSSTHLPEAEFDINVSNNWLVIWREMTRWNWFLGDVFDPHTNAVARALANKAEKEYAFFDGVTGEPAPDGFFWISQPRVAIAGGMAYQRYVDTAGAVWVLESNGMVADINGTTNGYIRISDDQNNVQFEIVKGNSRTVAAAPGALTRSSVMGVTHWHTTYVVTNAVSAPKAMFCRDLTNPEWYAEDAAGCPCNVDWTHPSEGIYVCEWWTQGNEPAIFMRSQYGQGSESRIIQNAPVEVQHFVINGVKGKLGTATINGITVLTFTPGTP